MPTLTPKKEAAPANFIETILYNGKVTIKFFPESHIYYVNGKRKGSVTGAIGIIDKSRALVPWAVGCFANCLRGKLGEEITEEIILEGENAHEIRKKEAASVGTTAHDWIEQFVKGNNPPMPENKQVLQAVTNFLDWVDEKDIKFIDSEKVVYSRKHDYIGTMDAVATMNGGRKKYVIDYKVSNGLYAGVAYQTAAYLKADEEESGTQYAGRWAIRLSKETEEEYYERQEEKLAKYLRKYPNKDPYQIAPYMAFEARFLDEPVSKVERDFHIFTLANELAPLHFDVDKEFYNAS